MANGVILDVQGQKAVVLVEGSFQRLPAKPGWQVGDQIDVAAGAAGGSQNWRRWAWVAAAAVLIGSVAPLGWAQYSLAQPVAIISLDINPSLQVTVNKEDKALSCKAVNADGQVVLDAIQCQGHTLADVVRDATSFAVDKGYMKAADGEAAVLVAVAPAGAATLDTVRVQRLESAGRTNAQSVLVAKGVTGQAVAIAADGKERDAAAKAGQSVGRYVLMQELTAKVPDAAQQLGITPEKLAEMGPIELTHELNRKLNLSIRVEDILSDRSDDHAGHGKSTNDDKGGGKGKEQGQPGKGGTPGAPPNGNPPGTSSDKKDDKKADGKGDGKNDSKGDGKNDGTQGGKGDGKQGGKDDGKQGDGKDDVGPVIDVTLPLPWPRGLLPGGDSQPGRRDKSNDNKGNSGEHGSGKGDSKSKDEKSEGKKN